MIGFALRAVLLFSSVSAMASAPNCAVPVCDVPARLQALRAMAKNDRAKEILTEFRALAEGNARSSSAALWTNLLEYSRGARDLTLELQDEDYVVRETQNLLEISLLGVHKFGPLTLPNLVGTYREMKTRRFDALSFWDSVDRNDRYDEVSTIIGFLSEARKISAASGDPDWMLRKIEDLLSLASRRLSALDPIAEGMYEISFEPAEAPPSGGVSVHCPSVSALPDRLLIGNSMTSDGIVAEFMLHDINFAFFKNVVFTGDLEALRSSSISFSTASVFSMRLKKETGIVEGLFRNTRYACTYKFSGHRTQTPGLWLRDGAVANAPELKEILGVYEATIHNATYPDESLKGTLVLREYQQPGGLSIAASFFTDTMVQDFGYGYLVQPRGFLILNSTRGEQTLVRWHLAYRPDAQGVMGWHGFLMSFLNGRVNEISMHRLRGLNDTDDGLIDHP